MKKFYAFMAAALISVCAFASKDVVPSDEVLQGYYDEGKVCVCFFVPAEMNCNNIVVTGSFNGWKSSAEECVAVESVEGYDGWYVASFEPEAEPDAEKGIQAKPIMLDGDGKFNWDYQVGEATAIRGGVTVVEGGIKGEIDLINYSVDAPNVFTIEGWKNNPCTAVYHNYHFEVVSAGCDGFVVPFIVGGMTGWSFTQMQLDVEKTMALGVPTYVYNVKMAEEAPFQIVSGLMDDKGEIVEEPAWSDNSYLQKLVDDKWVRIPGESGDNLLTHAEPNIVFDLRDADLRWARCDGAVAENVIVALAAPEGAPESIEIIGSFDAWTGQAMTLEDGVWGAIVSAKATAQFKFREAGSWDNQIEYYDSENDTWLTFGDGHNELIFGELWEDGEAQFAGYKVITLDFKNPDAYRWQANAQGIENITLTEKAQKVVVDGVLYIIRDNKMFNVQGTQVR